MNTIEAGPPPSCLQRPVAYSSSKLQCQHLERLAVVYVRQSTLRQVLEHRESTELQHKLTLRAMKLGWRKDRIFGDSGTDSTGRGVNTLVRISRP